MAKMYINSDDDLVFEFNKEESQLIGVDDYILYPDNFGDSSTQNIYDKLINSGYNVETTFQRLRPGDVIVNIDSKDIFVYIGDYYTINNNLSISINYVDIPGFIDDNYIIIDKIQIFEGLSEKLQTIENEFYDDKRTQLNKLSKDELIEMILNNNHSD